MGVGTRDYNFSTGPDTPTLPTASTPVASADIITKGYADATYAALAPSITGTRASPQAITALGGIAFVGTGRDNIWFVQGTGAGTTTVTVNPAIAVGVFVGQKLKVAQRSATNILKFTDGSGLDLDGVWVGDDASRELNLWWDGTNWKEEGRR